MRWKGAKTLANIFVYEVKRLLLNRFTLAALAVTLAYGHLVMQGEIVLGVANTAPFSPWSFGLYLARVMPLLMAALLMLVSFLYDKRARAVGVLTDAACLRPARYRLARCAAAAAAFLLVALAPVAYAAGFYGAVFGFTAFSSLLAPLALGLLPAFLLTMGVGLWAGRLHPAAVPALVPAALLAGAASLPEWMDLYGTAFLARYPATLGMLDPPFGLSSAQAVCKALCAAAGVILIWAAIAVKEKRRRFVRPR